MMNEMNCKKAIILTALTMLCSVIFAQEIKLNQLGFYPKSEKIAVVPSDKATKFKIVDAEGTVHYNGKLSKAKTWEPSGEVVSLADFSSFDKKGTFELVVPKVGQSYRFTISDQVFDDVFKASVKAFYYNRASIEIDEEHGGKWARAAGHPDTSVLIHVSAANNTRPTGTVISSPKGWYDAGDYNKYIVNSGITMYTLLTLYEHFPSYVSSVKLTIPEKDNNLPDLLDEVLWNLEWMLTMQDPNDGGVYHKLTNLTFDGVDMPEHTVKPRYVVKKGTAATLDFAAVMAVAYRVFKNYEKEKPGLANQCLEASQKAWEWAVKNPRITFENPDDVKTGEYGDKNLSDEFTWAATELYLSTNDKQYWDYKDIMKENNAVSNWADVFGLPWISLLHHSDKLPEGVSAELVKSKMLTVADRLKEVYQNAAYKVAMGGDKGDFVWGSNAVAANQGIVLIQAYRATKDQDYLNAAIATLDYLLGRNPLSYSYVTGFGTKSTQNPHHRPSQADKVKEPVPGFLAGGPNPGKQDKCDGYPSDKPAMAYVDAYCSYASNEIAINWNAPLVYLIGAIEASMLAKK